MIPFSKQNDTLSSITLLQTANLFTGKKIYVRQLFVCDRQARKVLIERKKNVPPFMIIIINVIIILLVFQ